MLLLSRYLSYQLVVGTFGVVMVFLLLGLGISIGVGTTKWGYDLWSTYEYRVKDTVTNIEYINLSENFPYVTPTIDSVNPNGTLNIVYSFRDKQKLDGYGEAYTTKIGATSLMAIGIGAFFGFVSALIFAIKSLIKHGDD